MRLGFRGWDSAGCGRAATDGPVDFFDAVDLVALGQTGYKTSPRSGLGFTPTYKVDLLNLLNSAT